MNTSDAPSDGGTSAADAPLIRAEHARVKNEGDVQESPNVSDADPRSENRCFDCDVQWIDPIAMWCWESLKGKTCSICRVDLNETAIVASGSPEDTNDHASAFTDVYIGGCGHLFHRACIERWLRVRKVCPQCIQPWTLQAKKSATD